MELAGVSAVNQVVDAFNAGGFVQNPSLSITPSATSRLFLLGATNSYGTTGNYDGSDLLTPGYTNPIPYEENGDGVGIWIGDANAPSGVTQSPTWVNNFYNTTNCGDNTPAGGTGCTVILGAIALTVGPGNTVPFDPSTLTGVAAWYDPSDSTTVFTDTGCTSPAAPGNVVGCLKDKSSNHCNATSANGPTLMSSGGVAWLAFNGTTNHLDLTTTCPNIFSNVGYGLIHIAAQEATGSTGVPFSASTNLAANYRFACGPDSPGGNGWTGWGERVRRQDITDGFNVAVGTSNTSLLVARCDVRWADDTGNIYIDNAQAVAPQSLGFSTGNTDSTASALVTIGESFFKGNLYGMIVRALGSPPSNTDMANTDNWLCGKEGRGCTLTPSIAVNGSGSGATVAPGANIVVNVANGPGHPGDWVGICNSGVTPTAAQCDSAGYSWDYLNCSQTPPGIGVTSGTCTLVAPSAPGTYNVNFFNNNLYTVLASVPLTVSTGGGGGATITVNGTPNGTTVTPGASLSVAVASGPANTTDRMLICNSGVTPSSAECDGAAGYNWDYLNCSHTPPGTGVTSATCTIVAPSTNGAYNAVFASNGTYTVLASAPFSVSSGGGGPVGITVDGATNGATVSSGATLSVAVSGGPGNAKDWMSICAYGVTPSHNSCDLNFNWDYLNCSQTAPGSGVTSATCPLVAPSAVGTYNTVFFANDIYTVLASAPFAVSATPSSPSILVNGAASGQTVFAGASVKVSVADGPGNATDRMLICNHGVTPSSAQCDGAAGFNWGYLNCSHAAPGTGVTVSACSLVVPSTAGTYDAVFASNGSYTVLATATFTVSPIVLSNCTVGPQFTGAIPAPAQMAGLTQCAANWDFSDSFYTTLDNWLDCSTYGTFTPGGRYQWHLGGPGTPSWGGCNQFAMVTDPTIGKQVLQITQTANTNSSSVMMTEGASGQPGYPIEFGFPYNYFIQEIYRVNELCPQCQQNTGGPNGVFVWNMENMVGGGHIEVDPGEIYTDTGGFGDVGVVNWGNQGCQTGSCRSLGNQFYPPGWNPVQYATYEVLFTSNGTDMYWCPYVNGTLIQGQCQGNPGSANGFFPDATENILVMQTQGGSPPLNYSVELQSIRIFECPGFVQNSSTCLPSQHTPSSGPNGELFFHQ